VSRLRVSRADTIVLVQKPLVVIVNYRSQLQLIKNKISIRPCVFSDPNKYVGQGAFEFSLCDY